MRVLVCGGRYFWQQTQLYMEMHNVHRVTPITAVIHGGATGADQMAGHWARRNNIKEIEFKADWQSHGRAAGPIRNARMLTEGVPDLVMSFHGGRGTLNMVRQAKMAGVKVWAQSIIGGLE